MKKRNDSAFYALIRIKQMKEACFDLRLLLIATHFTKQLRLSEQGLRVMESTEQEQAEAMKRYIREVVIPEYVKDFNKGLSAEDIKFYRNYKEWIFEKQRVGDGSFDLSLLIIASIPDYSQYKYTE